MAKKYRKKLSGLDASGFMFTRADSHLCLLTGQSSFVTSRLEFEKLNFINYVSDDAMNTITMGFPWHNTFDVLAHQPSLIAASIRNFRQYIWLNVHVDFQRNVSNIINELVQRTYKKLIIITGSCGIKYLSCALENITVTNTLWVLALGPVGNSNIRRENISRFHVIQGKKDMWSQLLWRGIIDIYQLWPFRLL